MIAADEQLLQRIAALGRSLVCGLPGAGALIVDANLRIVAVAGDIHRGLCKDTTLGRTVPDVVPALAWNSLRPRYAAALAGQVQVFEYEARTDGSRHVLRFVPVPGEDDPVGVLVLSQLATSREATSLKLADSESTEDSVLEILDERDGEHRRQQVRQERLRETHDLAKLASWEWRPDTDEIVVLHPLPGDEMALGEPLALEDLLATMPPEAQRQARIDLASIASGEREETVRRMCQTGPSGHRWVESRARAVRAKDRRLLCVRGTSQDVTEQEEAERAARRARDFFQSTVDSLSARIAVLDECGELLMTNRRWVQFAAENDGGFSGVGENYLEACDRAAGDSLAACAAAGLRAVIAGVRDEYSLEYPCHSPSAERWFMLRAARFDGPGRARVVVAHDDVTQRHEAETQATTRAALLDEVDVAVVAADTGGYISHWNRGAENVYGWTATEAIGRRMTEIMSPVEPVTGDEGMAELRRASRWEGEVETYRRDGTSFPAYLRDRVMFDAEERVVGLIRVSVDMTERLAVERAAREARNDLRAVAHTMGEGMFTLDPRARLIYMNPAAEELLGWSSDDLAGRVIHHIIHARQADGAERPIEECQILRARRDGNTSRIEDNFVRRDGRHLPVSYTVTPIDTDAGAGCMVVFQDISERKAREAALAGEAEKLTWIARIREALVEDRFVLYAQPIFDLATEAIVQRELLLRLCDEDGAIVGPGAFLGVAEAYGLIGDIDRWVIRRACELAATGAPVELNVSARSIGEEATLEHIRHCIQQTGVDPRLLVFEVTETALVDDEEAASRFAEGLHDLGCRLALDDFGTGYGGFTYLKRLPLDFLKIDIEFVRDLSHNPASRHVVEAVVALAWGFGLQTVAEGVEDALTVELLGELGVDYAQGYHLGRPAPYEP